MKKGKVVDGDQILGALANAWLKTDELNGGGIVTTVMSNLGSRYILILKD